MRAGNMGSNWKPPRGDFPRPAAGGGLDWPLVQRSREDDRVAGLSRNSFQIVRGGGNIIARGMSIGRSRKGLRGRERAGTHRKRLKEDTPIRFEHDALPSFAGRKGRLLAS